MKTEITEGNSMNEEWVYNLNRGRGMEETDNIFQFFKNKG